jgi:Carboxypeptidase regulatory-like domain/Domain of unknown function (DUF4214)
VKKNLCTRSHSQTIAQHLLLSNTRGRLIALFVMVFVGAFLLISTGAWAKTKNSKRSKRELTLTTQSAFRPRPANTNGLRQRRAPGASNKTLVGSSNQDADDGLFVNRKPTESHLIKAHEFKGDLRKLPQTPPVKMERPEREPPDIHPRVYGPVTEAPTVSSPGGSSSLPGTPAAPAPTPLISFEGLDFATWGDGHPPDPNGDVGPTYFIETINTSIGIYNKSTGGLVTAFTFNTFMSQGAFGNLCDTNNFGDPVVLYDTFEDRWIVTDFAFTLDGSNNVINPPGAFECFAASKSGDPVSGGWNFYSINTTGGLGDYPKFGIWPDGLYMSVNMFDYAASGSFQNPRVYAFNKAQMYAGAPSVQSVSFDAPSADFTILPSNARLQTGTPPPGTPNYFLSTWEFVNAVTVYKFHVDWNSISTSTFTGPDVPVAATSWPNATVPNAPSLGGNSLDVLQIRAMMQNQYSNIGDVESLWATHTVRRGDTTGFAAPRFYQVPVTGGTVGPNITQAATWDPDGANVIYRFMPSLAVDRAGNMALGYSTSSSTTKPAIKYAGRLATDPINTLSLTEQVLIQGAGTQTGNCGGSPCTRWGDYSAMTLDPDGCTFWYTNMYYPVDGLDHHTRIGSFQFSPCTPVASGTVQGTVTATAGGAPISGATITFGSRTTTTNGSGFYQFLNIPSGTYPSIIASASGFNSGTAVNIVVTDGATTARDFSLGTAPLSLCLTDTTQSEFQTGVPTSVDLTSNPGDVILSDSPILDQQNTTLSNFGVGITATTWGGQTFTPALTGQLTRADINLFCSGCTGTFPIPNLTLSVRATSGGLPTGADIATTTLAGSPSGGSSYFAGTFSSPPTLTAGTVYALVVRPIANPSAGTYALTRSSTNVYAGGQRVSSTDSGGSWSATGQPSDAGFKTYMKTGFAAAGNQVSTLKDSNPAIGQFTHWASLSWNATVPANTTLQFQVAASNNADGPFNFVGPDGTAATFFTTSPATIFILNGNRYLKYKAYLTTTNSTVTPTVNDVTVCFNNTAAPTATNGIVSGRISDQNGASVAGAVVNLSGSQNRKTITDSAGNYRFESVETTGFYTVAPSLLGYHFSPENRSFSLLGNKTDALFTATRDAAVSGNVIDTAEYFVRQHYVDFLGREPDESGFNFWSDQMLSCGSDTSCLEQKRINVSAAYFLSIEFQETGGLVDALYRASYGRRPLYAEFMPDAQNVARGVIVGQSNWSQLLTENKQAFVEAWIQRPAFVSTYGSLGDDKYVDALISHTGVSFSQSERDALVSSLSNGALTRAAVLQRIAEDERFVAAKLNETFVMMEYFGYLRRDPDESGYQFWLNKLRQFNGNFVQAEMVKAFISSAEYRQRFGQ